MKKLIACGLALTLTLLSGAGLPTAYAAPKVSPDCVMVVDGKEYTDFGEGWMDAVSDGGATITLYRDWLAGDTNCDGVIGEGETPGAFRYIRDGVEIGTNNGRLYVVDGSYITIDLNGFDIDRGLTEPVEHGQVMRIDRSTVMIKDGSDLHDGRITGGNNTGKGGAFYVTNHSALKLHGVNVVGNRALHGGGIAMEGSTHLYALATTIQNNVAEGDGGGVWIYSEKKEHESLITMWYTSLRDNMAENGGGLYMDVKSLLMDTVTQELEIQNNKATGKGGGVYYRMPVKDEFLELEGHVHFNEAEYGGGIYKDEGRLGLSRCSITGNKASQEGGGVFATHEDGDLWLGSLTLVENTAGGAPSNLFLDNEEVNINNDDFYGTVGISIGYEDDDDQISADDTSFDEETAAGFFADDPDYGIVLEGDELHIVKGVGAGSQRAASMLDGGSLPVMISFLALGVAAAALAMAVQTKKKTN